MSLPAWLSEKIGSPPAAGTGLHAWLFSCARQLHAHLEPKGIFDTLQGACANVGRHVPAREIRDAVNNSQSVAWRPRPFGELKRNDLPKTLGEDEAKGRWPKVDAMARRGRIRDASTDGVAGLADLWEKSSTRPKKTADDWLEWLFPGAEWLCLADDHPSTARTKPPTDWFFGRADECGLVVPSEMIARVGSGLDGRISHRCLGNTGPRRWLVIEFDSGSIDEQASLHWHLREAAATAGWPRLQLCVHSGMKSLHGWYGHCSTDEAAARDLMAYAVTLGADPATWVRCQLVRLPGGRRKRDVVTAANLPSGFEQEGQFVTQEVFYYCGL